MEMNADGSAGNFQISREAGHMADFLSKLQQAGSPRFNSPVMPKTIRLWRSAVPGPDTQGLVLTIEYDDMAAYGARTAYENGNAEWRKVFEAKPDSPETLMIVELLIEFTT
jgi:hypothetical protein